MQCHIRPKTPIREQKIIIFDSPDGTGKTELARGLSFTLNVPYFRMDNQHDNWRNGKYKEALEFDQTYSAEFVRQTKANVVMDRAYPSEWVYSSVFGRETNMEVLERVDRAFARMGAYIVIPVRHDYSVSRKDEVVPEHMHQKLHDKYMEFRKWTKCSTITIYVDAFDNDINKQLPLIVDELKFGEQLLFGIDIVLDKPKKDMKDLSDLFSRDPVASRDVGLKRMP